ncbi:MAG: hypothetical protein ACFWT2_11910 [Thermoanaerobacterium thermosaccharolyticum]
MKKWILVVFVSLLAILIVGCSSNNNVSNLTPEEAIKQVLGTPQDKDKDSGVTKVEKDGDEYVVTYNFFPVGVSDFNSELGVKLTQKIKQLYEDNKQIDKLQFVCYGPYEDDYGNITWKPVVSFKVSRAIFNKINWDNFSDTNLIKIAEDVQQFR